MLKLKVSNKNILTFMILQILFNFALAFVLLKQAEAFSLQDQINHKFLQLLQLRNAGQEKPFAINSEKI